MASPNPETKMRKGQPSLNPKGRPKGTAKPISRLRSTLNKLKGLEPEAVEIIEKIISGAEVDKSQADTAKWVISMINTLTKGAIAEESYKLDARERQSVSKEEQGTGTEGKPSKRFSIQMISDEE